MKGKELAHSLNIQMSKEIANKLGGEQKKLSKEFSEKRFYDSSPHLAIATKFMGEEKTDEFIEALKNEFRNDTAWELEFSDFRISDTIDYIFLHLNTDSEQKLINLHNRVLKATKNIGLEVQTGNKFRHFSYIPHISIIKLSPEEADKALNVIRKDFSEIKMRIDCFEITRQTDDEKGFSNFPIIDKINLLR